MSAPFMSLTRAVGLVGDDSSIAMGKLFPMAIVRELVRQNKRRLHMIGMPIAGLPADLLSATGVLSSVETGAITLGPLGAPRNFLRAETLEKVARIRSSCSLIVAGLVGGAAGMPFVAVPGVQGSDLLSARRDFLLAPNPYAPDTDVILMPVIRPDFALIHAKRADPSGNLVVSALGDESLLARAANTTIATVEEISDDAIESLGPDEEIIPALHVGAIVEMELATHPFVGHDGRGHDAGALAAYVEASETPECFSDYIEATISSTQDEDGYRRIVAP